MKRIAMIIALVLAGCENPAESPPEENPSTSDSVVSISPLGRELGTLTAIYPIPNPDGSYSLELRMTKDTVTVDLESLQSFASDSVGRALIRSTLEPFYTLNERCFYSPRKETCLEFREAQESQAKVPGNPH